jgi:hypothetical protein
MHTQHELRRNLSLVDADLYRYGQDLHRAAAALEAIVSQDECSLEAADALTHLSCVSVERIDVAPLNESV